MELIFKKRFRQLATCLLAFSLLIGCKEDGPVIVDGNTPIIELESEVIQSVAGRQFQIKGSISDKDGISSINLYNKSLYLDKTIDLEQIYDETIYDYDLLYKFMPEGEIDEDSTFDIIITVVDLAGKQTKVNQKITMDGDFTNPVFTALPDKEITVLIKAETKLNLRFTAVDNKELKTVDISIPEIDYVMTDDISGQKEYSFSEMIILPSTSAVYNVSIKVTDQFGLTAETVSKVSVSNMPDFAKMYLIDVEKVEDLNSDLYGVPMLIERTAEYTYTARYYTKKANTEVRFAPQKTDFSPICFGIDPTDESKLTDDPTISLPIILPDANQYYAVTFNVKSGDYSFETYIPSDEPMAIGEEMLLDPSRPGEGSIPLEIGLVGKGFPVSADWSTSEPHILTQDATNPYILYTEFDLVAGAELEFIISAKHSWGWWPEPFWRHDRGEDPEANVFNGGENMNAITIKKGGKYRFELDTHLLRSKLYPINK